MKSRTPWYAITLLNQRQTKQIFLHDYMAKIHEIKLCGLKKKKKLSQKLNFTLQWTEMKGWGEPQQFRLNVPTLTELLHVSGMPTPNQL